MAENDVRLLKTKCPMCKNKAVYAFRPFCSKACKDHDLSNWLSGSYVVPSDPEKDKIILDLDEEDDA